MRIRREDISESDKLWVRLEAEKAKDFSQEFETINEKILGLYTQLDKAKKLHDGTTAYKISGEIESLESQKFKMMQKKGEEVERLTKELAELSAPYIVRWIEELQGEANRILAAKVFEIVKTERNLVAETKTFVVSTNLYHVAEVTKRIQAAIRELRGMIAPLKSVESFYQKTLNDIPDISNLKMVQVTLSELDFNEFKDSFAPAVGKLTELNYFKAEEMARVQGEAEELQRLITRRKRT